MLAEHESWQVDHFPEGQLFDLARDPGETTNLWSAEPRIAAELLDRLRRIVATAATART